MLRQYLDSALDDITTKSDGKVQFTEVFTEPEVGIVFRYRSMSGMPCPGASACTFIDEYSPDMSVKHATIYVSTDNPIIQYNGVFRRELMRTMITGTYSLDPSFIQSFIANTSVLHPDEGKALSIMYTLKHNTDMRGHKEIVIQDPVPVELTMFNALKKDNIVKLLWNTATEMNNYGFEVERKKDAWEEIAFVQGNGNSSSPKDYTYADTLKMPGIYFYRLKQIDNDGQFEYSAEVKINMEDIIKGYELMQNYPNPFNPETKIGFKIPERSNVKLTIYDVIGNTVSTLVDKQLEPGYYEEPFDGKALSSGVYFYRLITNKQTFTRKMLLIK